MLWKNIGIISLQDLCIFAKGPTRGKKSRKFEKEKKERTNFITIVMVRSWGLNNRVKVLSLCKINKKSFFGNHVKIMHFSSFISYQGNYCSSCH
jgi:hypothetical protein